jgi:hypothetical protein
MRGHGSSDKSYRVAILKPDLYGIVESLLAAFSNRPIDVSRHAESTPHLTPAPRFSKEHRLELGLWGQYARVGLEF